MSRKYTVYVVELSKKVFSKNYKFRNANPQYNGVLECLYVGMTSKTDKQRLQQHLTGQRSKKGHKLSSNIVQQYGLYLRPSLYRHLEPKTRAEALSLEKELTLQLRRQRYAVWSN
jgi:predicted GIY-YIG superfamily endonuclease